MAQPLNTTDAESREVTAPAWGVFRGTGFAADSPQPLPDPPPWRRFQQAHAETAAGRDVSHLSSDGVRDRGATYKPDRDAIEMVNTALFLRRPLLVTGKPGTGKSTLPYSVARELGFGPVLRWNITSRSTLKEGLYDYDALARLNDYNVGERRSIGDYIRLGPLGTALLPHRHPRVLLIDEIDKSDIDLPNDLLNIFEEGSYTIPELFRMRENEEAVKVLPSDGDDPVEISRGEVRCTQFPFVVMTSNGERDFPPPFLRRCIRLRLAPPDRDMLTRIVDAHFPDDAMETQQARQQLIADFMLKKTHGDLATDQLLNAVFLTIGDNAPVPGSAGGDSEDGGLNAARDRLIASVLRYLDKGEAEG